MYVLNEQQISFILDDIRRNGIEMEELQLNLLDHICCIVENEMPPDKNFDDFYRSIIPRFFKRELREIQEETNLLLTFKHYYAMKNVMIKSGAISAVGIILGSIFKIMHWPGASAIILLSVVTISFVFLPLLYVLKAKEVKVTREKTVLALATLIGILFCISTLFKIMHWPWANIMWLVCLGILFFLFLPIYFFGGIRNPDTKINTIISSCLILFAGGMLFALTSLRSSRWWEFVNSASVKHIFTTSQFAAEQNKINFSILAKDSSKLQADVILANNTCNQICDKIESLKSAMVDAINQNLEPKLNSEEILEEFAGNYDVPTYFLFLPGEDKPKANIADIKKDLNDLRAMIKAKFNRDVTLFNTADINKFGDPADIKVSWEVVNFFHVPYEIVIRNLTQIQLDVRLVQATCIK